MTPTAMIATAAISATPFANECIRVSMMHPSEKGASVYYSILLSNAKCI